MKRFTIASTCFFALALSPASAGQAEPVKMLAQSANMPAIAGKIPLGVTAIEMEAIISGWSVKNDLLGKSVQNEKRENLGTIEDIIITPKNSVSFAIISVGGFIGIGERRVAIPMRQLRIRNNQIELPGATKDVLKAMPPFVYSH